MASQEKAAGAVKEAVAAATEKTEKAVETVEEAETAVETKTEPVAAVAVTEAREAVEDAEEDLAWLRDFVNSASLNLKEIPGLVATLKTLTETQNQLAERLATLEPPALKVTEEKTEQVLSVKSTQPAEPLVENKDRKSDVEENREAPTKKRFHII